MPLQTAPVVPSWRQPTTNELTAIVDFFETTRCIPPLRLRQPIIETWRTVSSTLSMDDVFWHAVGVAGLMYAPCLLPPGKHGFESVPAIIELGIASVAGTVPEMAADLGYDPQQLVYYGYLRIKPWTSWDFSNVPRAEIERIGECHRAMWETSNAAIQAAVDGYAEWNDRVRDAQKADPRRARQDRWIHGQLAKCLTNIAPPEEARRRVAAMARARGRTDLCGHPDEAYDVFAAYTLANLDRPIGERTWATTLDKDGVWHADASGILDGAEIGPGKERFKETCATDYLAAEETAAVFAEIALSNDDPALLAEAAELKQRIRDILTAEAKDDFDRRNVDLLLEGFRCRTERAKKLGKGESFLRRREVKMREKALRKADAEMRLIIEELLAA